MFNPRQTLILLIFSFATIKAVAQANPTISVLPGNSGVVAVGSTLDLQIDIGNTGLGTIAVAKLRPNIAVPASVTFLPVAEQTGLPAGWTILSNSGSQLRVCNTSFVVQPQSSTTIILKVRGVTVTPAQTFSGQINFGNGTTCAAGTAVAGNNTADDNATSTIEVVAAPVPLTLVGFNASLSGCEPSLTWITEAEINSDRFEIERNEISNANAGWKIAGEVTATGTLTRSSYKFTDVNLHATSARVYYRLKIIDKDGSYKYSDVLPVFINCKTIQVQVFPNPVQDGRLYVSLTGAKGKTEATLLSISGQVISKNKLTNGTSYLDVSGVVNGSYVLKVKDADGLDKKVKVIIQK